jgi:putative DNA primase/helicase
LKASADRTLEDKLAAEASGILNWAVRGCLLWQAEGLEMPGVMQAAVNAYKRDEDRLADFIEDETFDSPTGEIPNGVLYDRYKVHCEDNGTHPWSSKALGKALREERHVAMGQAGQRRRLVGRVASDGQRWW